jgi:hypothetical protein
MSQEGVKQLIDCRIAHDGFQLDFDPAPERAINESGLRLGATAPSGEPPLLA